MIQVNLNSYGVFIATCMECGGHWPDIEARERHLTDCSDSPEIRARAKQRLQADKATDEAWERNR